MAEPIDDKPLTLDLKITGAASLVMSMEQIATELEGQLSLPAKVLRGKMELAAARLRQAVAEWREELRENRKGLYQGKPDADMLEEDICPRCRGVLTSGYDAGWRMCAVCDGSWLLERSGPDSFRIVWVPKENHDEG